MLHRILWLSVLLLATVPVRANEVALWIPHKITVTAGDPKDKPYGEMTVTVETTKGDPKKRRIKAITWTMQGKTYSVPAKELLMLGGAIGTVRICEEADRDGRDYIYISLTLTGPEDRLFHGTHVFIDFKDGKLQPLRAERYP